MKAVLLCTATHSESVQTKALALALKLDGNPKASHVLQR